MQPTSDTFEKAQTGAVAAEPYVSIAIFAWNEERAVPTLLNSLFQQSLFAQLEARNLKAEIICVLNGCTDRTAEVANAAFEAAKRDHPNRTAFSGRVENLAQRGKINAWNQYVHSVSARGARYLVMMDADIIIHAKDTLLSMVSTLEQDSQAMVAVDQPCKDIAWKKTKSVTDRLSLGMSHMTKSADGQLCGQLYCIRAEVARKIYLPKDLPACEDGFIKALVCTGFLSHEIQPSRIRVAEGAAHTFEAYTSPRAILKNQKRQIIGQTVVHILVDDYLKSLPLASREDLPGTLRAKDASDPIWLKRLLGEHLRKTKVFWRLYPGLLGQRFIHLGKLVPLKRLRFLPSATASVVVGFAAAWAARKTLKTGAIAYWPKANRVGFERMPPAIGNTLS